MREAVLPGFINLVLYLSSFATSISVSSVTWPGAPLLPHRDGHIAELPFPAHLQDQGRRLGGAAQGRPEVGELPDRLAVHPVDHITRKGP